MAEISSMHIECIIDKDDFNAAGEASSRVKKSLNMLGIPPKTIKRIAVAMYEAEINAFIHEAAEKRWQTFIPTGWKFLSRTRKGNRGSGAGDAGGIFHRAGGSPYAGVRCRYGPSEYQAELDELNIDSAPGKGTRVKMKFKLS